MKSLTLNEAQRAAYRQLSPSVFYIQITLSVDFKIIGTNLAGISSIEPQNEEALDYLINEAHLSVFQDGSSVLFDERIGDFISDAGWAHLSTELV